MVGSELPAEGYGDDDDDDDRKIIRVPPNRPNHYGSIDGKHLFCKTLHSLLIEIWP